MGKRINLFAFAFTLFASTLPAFAQQAERVYRIGFLHPGSFVTSTRIPPFIRGLRDHGYIEGRNILIEYRFANGKSERVPALAADLVRRKVDLIVCPGSVAQAAVNATRTIPIVVAVAGNFVARGWAKSLRRPGGNVTGLSTQAVGLAGKQLQLLKEIVPGLARVGVIGGLNNRGNAEEVRRSRKAATTLGLGVVDIMVDSASDLPLAFRRLKAEGVDAIIVLRNGFLVQFRRTVAALARKAKLPTLFGHRVEVIAGGLMSYGADTLALYRGVGAYVDKILKGADPAEIPISQAVKFELVVNLKTAKALGITIPSSILLRADEVIE